MCSSSTMPSKSVRSSEANMPILGESRLHHHLQHNHRCRGLSRRYQWSLLLLTCVLGACLYAYMWSKTPTVEFQKHAAVLPISAAASDQHLPALVAPTSRHSSQPKSGASAAAQPDPRKSSIDRRALSESIIKGQRDIIAQELADYPFQNGRLDDYLVDAGGSPRQNIIVTTWRSGSTFLTDILNSHPAMYCHYEPLMDFGIHRMRHGEQMEKALINVRRLMNCDYGKMGDYISYSRAHLYVLNHNWRLWRYCDDGRRHFCWRPSFLSRFCRLFPFQTTKTVRLALNATAPLLASQPQLRALLLVRDPRATMQSRSQRSFCSGHDDCQSAAVLCADLEQDYWAARQLVTRYTSSRVRVVRYEDFSVGLNTSVPALLSFMGLQDRPSIHQFLNTHTAGKKGDVSSTYRDSTVAPFLWARSSTWSQISDIQSKCPKAMELWGYRTMTRRDWDEVNSDSTGTANARLLMFSKPVDVENLL